jgi:carbon-monoxide dehydrogenase medium subunit
MYDFAYHRPKSLGDAVNALKGKDEARPMAGGMTLIPTLKQRLAKPTDVVDLGGIKELAGIKVEGSNVVIGAMTKHFEVASSADVKRMIPALAELAGMIGDPAVRNRGTIGGSVANSDPAADYPAAVLGLNATITTNTGKHTADGFFKGLFETALGEGELITSFSFPKADKAAYMKFRNPASRFALVGVYVADFGGQVRVAVSGAGPCAFRQADMEKALSAKFAPEAVAGVKVKADGLNNDLHASPEYRAHLITVMAKRAVEQALR